MTDSKTREDLARILRSCGAGLRSGQSVDITRKKAWLRELQEEARGMTMSKTDPELRTVAFAICLWIDHYYFNMSGTFPSQISESIGEVRHRLLTESVGPSLLTLAENLSCADRLNFDSIVNLFTAYLDALQEAGGVMGGPS